MTTVCVCIHYSQVPASEFYVPYLNFMSIVLIKRRYIAEILPIQRKTLSNQSIYTILGLFLLQFLNSLQKVRHLYSFITFVL